MLLRIALLFYGIVSIETINDSGISYKTRNLNINKNKGDFNSEFSRIHHSRFKIPRLSERIIAGYNCTLSESSHLASIAVTEKNIQYCGGSLIDSQWVLTAAHCCEDMGPDLLKKTMVHFGQTVWMKDVTQSSGVEKVYLHIDYDPKTKVNDICLMKLNTTIITDSRVAITKPVTESLFHDMLYNKQCTRATIIGFGIQRQHQVDEKVTVNIDDPLPKRIHCGSVEIITRQTCQKLLPKKIIGGLMFCARDADGKAPIATDTCQGDSGGPIYCNGYQIGIVAGGFGCGLPENPGMYTRVDSFIDFIDNVMGINRRNAGSTASTMSFTKSCFTFKIIYVLIILFVKI